MNDVTEISSLMPSFLTKWDHIIPHYVQSVNLDVLVRIGLIFNTCITYRSIAFSQIPEKKVVKGSLQSLRLYSFDTEIT